MLLQHEMRAKNGKNEFRDRCVDISSKSIDRLRTYEHIERDFSFLSSGSATTGKMEETISQVFPDQIVIRTSTHTHKENWNFFFITPFFVLIFSSLVFLVL